MGCAGDVHATAVPVVVAAVAAACVDAAVVEAAVVAAGDGVALESVMVWPPAHPARRTTANTRRLIRTNDMMERIALRAL